MIFKDRYEAVAGLAAVALAPAAVGALLLFTPLRPAEVSAGWLAVLTGAFAATAGAVATIPSVARGLRTASPQLLGRAGALGTLTVGLWVTTLQAVSRPSAFPATSLALSAVVAAVVLLAVAWLPRTVTIARENVLAATLVIFGALEASLAAALLVPPGPRLSIWLLIAAALAASLSMARGPWLPPALIAAGLGTLAIARVGSLDAMPPMLALGAGMLLFAVHGLREDRAEEEAREAAVAREAEQFARQVAEPEPRVVAAAPIKRAPPVEDDEATRLARELRGTIVELLQARRTIELQRDELVRATTVDPLTGVASRHALSERLRFEAAEARRYDHPVALVLLDIDGFTAINREHGTAVGDQVLREVALRLRLRMRSADALGRAGADSFVALLPHTDETGATTFAEALLERLLSRPIETDDGELEVGVSVGIGLIRPGTSLNDEELMAESEAALGRARASGGGQIAFDRPDGEVRLGRRGNASTPERPRGAARRSGPA